MKNSPTFHKFKPLQKLNNPILWAILAVLQLIVLLLFWLTWPSPITLAFVVPSPEAEHWQPLIQEFQTKNPDLRINLIKGKYTTDEVEASYTAAFRAGNSPYDLVYLDIIWVANFAAAGWLEDLSNLMSPLALAEFLKADLEAGRYQGKLYRIPFRSDVGMLYYRKDLLAATNYQPPQTFADLEQISQSLQAQKTVRWGYLWQQRQYEGLVAMFVEVLKGYGGFWIDPVTEKVGLDQPPALEAVQFLRQTIEQGISPRDLTAYDEAESLRTFQQGEAAFLRNWPEAWAKANAVPSLRGKVGIVPMVGTKNHRGGGCKGGWGLGIAKNAKHPQAARRAVEFFTSAAAQRQFIWESSYLPSRRALFTEPPLVERYSYLPQLLKVVEDSVLRPALPEYDQASQILQGYLSAALKGQLPPQAALQLAANETRQLLSKS